VRQEHHGDARFPFTFFDVQSDAYNPAGAVRAEEVRLPWSDHTVDRAVASPGFTHLHEASIVRYVSELYYPVGVAATARSSDLQPTVTLRDAL
jgi:hypothetical protein